MTAILEQYLTYALGCAAVAYALLAIRVSRSSPQSNKNGISLLLLLIAITISGSAISFAAGSDYVYSLGRVCSFFAAGFIPVAFYSIYRDYTSSQPGPLLIAVLVVVPIATTGLAMTNSMHNMLWAPIGFGENLQFSNANDHWWFNQVFAPFTYGLFGYTAVALIARLSTIPPAHRQPILLLLGCAVVPYGVSIATAVFDVGDYAFPHTSSTLALLLPLYAYASLSMRVYDFSPLAYQTLFDHVRDPVIVLDKEQAIICANRAAEVLLACSEKLLIGRKLWQDFPAVRDVLTQAKDLDLTQTLKFDNNSTYEVSVGPLNDRRGRNIGMVVVCRDVTKRRKALRQLADSEHLVRTLIETSSNGILRFSRDQGDAGKNFRCVYANRSAESLLGGSRGALVGVPLAKLDRLNPEQLCRHFNDPEQAGTSLSFELSAENDQRELWLRVVAEPVGDDFSVTVIDITQRKLNEDRMLADALRDPLTGLLNRRGFEVEGTQGVAAYERGAVLYLDLNGFKSINDRFGHQAGDALLKAFGHRLEFCLRPEDVLGRLGGDEFAIVLPGVPVDDARHVAERLVQTASEAYIIQGQEIRCTASVGIALMPKHGDELWELVSVADQAMYNAKSEQQAQTCNNRAAYVSAAIAS